MIILRALASGVWRSVPQTPARDWEKTMVIANEVARWAVNHRPVDVFPGLVVSFLEREDAEFFLAARRGTLPIIETGQLTILEHDDDARHFVNQGPAEALSQSLTGEQVLEWLEAQQQAAADAEADGASENYEADDEVETAPPHAGRGKAKVKTKTKRKAA